MTNPEPQVEVPLETPTGVKVDSSVNRLAVGAGVGLFGVVLGRGLDFVKQILLARLLGPDAFGLYALGWNFLRIVGILAPVGLQNGAMHFGTAYRRGNGGALKSILIRSIVLSFLVGWIITAILFLLAPWLTSILFKEPEYLGLFRVFALMLPFMGALRVAANATRISQRMQYSVAAEEISQATLNLILFAILYVFGWRLLGAVVSTVVSFAAALVFALYFLWRLFGPALAEPSRPIVSTRALLAYSAPTALAGMFGVIINRVDRLFLGFYRPAAEVGVYQAAAQISVIMALILNSFNMILMPMIAEQFHKKDMRQLEELFRVNTKWGIYCIVPVVLVIAFASHEVMTVLFGAEYAGGAAVLLILTVGQFVNIATGAAGTILIMTGNQSAWFRLSMLIMIVNVILNLTLIPRLGMIGAAIATATTVGGLFAIGLLVVYRLLRLWPYDRRYLKGVVAAVVAALLVFAARRLGLSPAASLLATGAVAAAAFFGILIALGLDPEDRAFIELILKRVRAK